MTERTEPGADAPAGAELTVRRLDAEGDVDRLQSLLERDPGYTERVVGFPPGPAEAQSSLLARPPDSAPEDKVPLVLVASAHGTENFVGFVDLILRFPTPADCYIGLVFVDPLWRRAGHATRLLLAAYQVAAAEQGPVGVAVAGFVESLGPDVNAFVRAAGFQPTGESREYRSGSVLSTLHLFQKALYP
jgi:GNAT superfamily N-acetyltransferase